MHVTYRLEWNCVLVCVRVSNMRCDCAYYESRQLLFVCVLIYSSEIPNVESERIYTSNQYNYYIFKRCERKKTDSSLLLLRMSTFSWFLSAILFFFFFFLHLTSVEVASVISHQKLINSTQISIFFFCPIFFGDFWNCYKIFNCFFKIILQKKLFKKLWN